MSTPAVGRIVHYYTRNPDHQTNHAGIGPYAAIITQVFEVEDGHVASLVNLTVLPPNSQPYTVGSVHGDGSDFDHGDLQSWWIWPPRT